MRVAFFTPHIIKIFSYNIKKVLTSTQQGFGGIYDVQMTIPNSAISVSPYTKANFRNGYVISQESQVYRKPENYEFFRKQTWFVAVHSNVQIDAEMDYMIDRVLDHGSFCFYIQKLCNLEHDLKRITFILITQKFPFVEYLTTGHQKTFAILKSSNNISRFQWKTVSLPLNALENHCLERIPIYFQNKLKFVDQVTRKTFPWSI